MITFFFKVFFSFFDYLFLRVLFFASLNLCLSHCSVFQCKVIFEILFIFKRKALSIWKFCVYVCVFSFQGGCKVGFFCGKHSNTCEFFSPGFFSFPREGPNNQSWLHNLQGLMLNENVEFLAQIQEKVQLEVLKPQYFSLKTFQYFYSRGKNDTHLITETCKSKKHFWNPGFM